MAERNYNIDSLRTVLALLVVFIHITVPYNAWIIPLSRCAVPIFFLISGYFLPWDSSIGVRKAVKSVFWLTLTWGIIYLLYSNCFIHRLGDFILYSPRQLWELLLFNRFAHGFHLWYLAAYLYALLFVLLLQRLNWLKYRYILIFILLFANFLLGSYAKDVIGYPLPFYYTRNGLFLALPLLLIGGGIRENVTDVFLCKSRQWLCLAFVLLYICYLFDSEIKRVEHSIAISIISTVLASMLLFVIVIGFGHGKDTLIARIGKEYSLYIYLLHPLFLPFLPFFQHNSKVLDNTLPFLVFGASLLASMVIVSFKKLIYEKRFS